MIKRLISISVGLILLCAALGLVIMGRNGICVFTPLVNDAARDGAQITCGTVAFYYFLLVSGIILFIWSFALFFGLIEKSLNKK